MASGIAIPVRASAGRTVTEAGEEQTKKVITLALSDGTSMLPFVRRGLRSVIFMTDGPALRGVIEQDVRVHFKRFERDHRAKLQHIVFGRASADGTLPVSIRYIDLRTDRDAELLIAFGGKNG